jgi:hypothetical protein
MKKIITFFTEIKEFILCFIKKDCIYSRKALLSFLTFNLIVYLAIFTEKDYYELIIFLSVLLGITSYDKVTWNKFKNNE